MKKRLSDLRNWSPQSEDVFDNLVFFQMLKILNVPVTAMVTETVTMNIVNASRDTRDGIVVRVSYETKSI